jgi:predicted transcriptional regulator
MTFTKETQMTTKLPISTKPSTIKAIASSNVVVPINSKADARKSSEKKYSKPVMDLGFCIVPSLLMQAQARLGINQVQFNIIMHLADIWWEKEHRPWPRKQLLAERMRMSERQIQRQIAELESAGLVQRVERTRPGRGKTSNEYDLSGLVQRLKALEPEFTKMKQEIQTRRKNAALPQHRRKA